MYKWIIKNELLQRIFDGAFIPWPPQESEGFKAEKEINGGIKVQESDPVIKQESPMTAEKLYDAMVKAGPGKIPTKEDIMTVDVKEVKNGTDKLPG